MLTIRRAVETDCGLIRSLADEVFPATYREIITPSQMDYMMKWMYAPEVLRREMRTGVAWSHPPCFADYIVPRLQTG